MPCKRKQYRNQNIRTMWKRLSIQHTRMGLHSHRRRALWTRLSIWLSSLFRSHNPSVDNSFRARLAVIRQTQNWATSSFSLGSSDWSGYSPLRILSRMTRYIFWYSGYCEWVSVSIFLSSKARMDIIPVQVSSAYCPEYAAITSLIKWWSVREIRS